MSKVQENKYILHYWPSIPGRGEYVRLAFEATGVEYKDESTSVPNLQSHVMSTDKVDVPPHFAPPILQIDSNQEGQKSKALKAQEGQTASASSSKTWYLSQTPAILAYLGQELNLLGYSKSDDEIEKEIKKAHVNQLVLTILDLSNEIHDVHHPM